MWENISENDRTLVALGGFFLVLSIISGAPELFGLALVIGAAFFFNNRDRWLGEDYDDDADLDSQSRPANVEQVYEHALRSVRAAGLDPNDIQVLAVDIGLISYKGEDDPVLHRTLSIDDDIDYVQPFVQVRIPIDAQGRITFELRDDTGQPVFIHEDTYQLNRGRNLVIPSTRLPIHDEQEMDGQWELRVLADNTVIAKHHFEWGDAGEHRIRTHMGEDGEINSELRAVISATRLESMSLDDLLAHQEEDEAEQARR